MERSDESYRMDRQRASALIGCWERDHGGAHPTYSQALTRAPLLAPAIQRNGRNAVDTGAISSQLAIDAGALTTLKRQAKDDPRAGLSQAAQQFEAVFLQMVLKSMRDATPQDGMFDSDQSRCSRTCSTSSWCSRWRRAVRPDWRR